MVTLFSMLLSLILVVAKIASLITLSWGLCLAPFLIVLGIRVLFWIIISIIAFIAAKGA